jgi:2-dehydropantoate 2-reductase
MRVAVMGAGGLGGYFGALLARAGNDVTLIARGEQLEAVRSRGLMLRSRVVGDITVHPAATDRCEEVGQVELLMMCVKTYDLESATVEARPLVGPDTVVVPVQNGVDAAETIGRAIEFGPVLGGATYVNAHREAPGVVRHGGGERLVFGELNGGRSDWGRALRAAQSPSSKWTYSRSLPRPRRTQPGASLAPLHLEAQRWIECIKR